MSEEPVKVKWVDVISPTVQTMKVGAMIKQSVVLDHDAADALAKLMTEMAQKLDLAIDMVTAQQDQIVTQQEQIKLTKSIIKYTDSLSGWLLWQWAGVMVKQ